MSGERKDYLSWDEFFMLEAIVASKRSKDPRTQVGAVIVDENNHLLSQGYNGAVRGMDDKLDMPWDSLGEDTGDIMRIKNTFVVHAEANAIQNYTGEKIRLNNSRMYVTLFPCLECTKMIITSGISKIIYLDMYSKEKLVMASRFMLNKAGVAIECFGDNNDIEKAKQKVFKI